MVRRTKIVATVGPATNTPVKLEKLISAGADLCRLNFSHGTYKEHLEMIKHIRKAAKKLDKNVGVLQDLCGPKIRIGEMHEPSNLVENQKFKFVIDEVKGDSEMVQLGYPEIFKQAKKGQMIYVDDAKLQFKITAVEKSELETRVVVGGILSSHKGFTVPGTSLNLPGVTEKDLEDLRFGLENGVDWVASSFVRSAADLKPLRKVMREVGKRVPVIAKIERPEAVKNVLSIIEAYDGIMIARGDLGIELPIDEVPMIQKTIIRHCNRANKPVITATQMLDSMESNARPTRAEVTDVANAIMDGTDATMLSGETAVGNYPMSSVRIMNKIALSTEKAADFKMICERRMDYPTSDVTESIAKAASKLANELNVSAIITCTFSGTTARLVSKYRPHAPIIAAASNDETARSLTFCWGVMPVFVEIAKDTDMLIQNAVEASEDAGLVKKGNRVLVIAGVPVGVPGNTSFMRVLEVK